MPTAEQKVTQYLQEAHASETGLIRELRSQIAMAPEGRFRRGLETHLEETYGHAERLEKRIDELGHSGNPFLAGMGVMESVSAQWLALAKAPFELVRGTGDQEKVLKNAKDAAAAEALEIATYAAIEPLARSVGDEETARLAASIREDEQRMLNLVLEEIPALSEAVAKADVGEGRAETPAETAAEARPAAAAPAPERPARTAPKRTGTRARTTPTPERTPGRD